MGEMVKRRGQAGGKVGWIERGAERRHDAKMGGRLADQWDKRQRVELWDRSGVAQMPFRRTAVGVGDK